MKLTVSNFQIHQKPKTVDIPEGETTYLEGDSDIGKSALMRATRWVGENKPDAGSFVTFKQPRGTNARVMLDIDGRLIIRERGKSTNLYKMDGETFEAFGRTVPEPIAKFLNLSPYAFQLQGEPSFLIGASPTEAAKILSDACGLGVIDTAVQFVRAKKTVIEAETRKAEILLESAQSRLTAATAQLPLADALEAAVRAGDDVEELAENVELLEDSIDKEPLGDVIDMDAVRRLAGIAHSCEAERGVLTTQLMHLCGAIKNEPTGECVDVSDICAATDKAHTCSVGVNGLTAKLIPLRHYLSTEPTGVLLDITSVYPRAAEARILGEWIADVCKSAESMRQRLQTEPMGELRDTTNIRLLVPRALAAFEEAAMLDKMVRTMRAALQNEPQGVLMDTTELQQQRAQIKVCPTCKREL